MIRANLRLVVSIAKVVDQLGVLAEQGTVLAQPFSYHEVDAVILVVRHFLLQAGIDADTDFKGNPNYSGSHDKTWKLVESGAF